MFAVGADTQIRTGDLILTKDALYRLSYISILRSADIILAYSAKAVKKKLVKRGEVSGIVH